MKYSQFWLRDSKSFENFKAEGDFLCRFSRSLFRIEDNVDQFEEDGPYVILVGGEHQWYPYEYPLGGMFRLMEIRRL